MRKVVWLRGDGERKAFDGNRIWNLSVFFRDIAGFFKAEENPLKEAPDGKYLLSVKGFRRKDFAQRTKMEQGAGACGFLFSFAEVEEFGGFENPREEAYDFNVGSME